MFFTQGFHDVCYTCLAVLGPDEAFAVLKQLVPKHFNVFMQETMDATSETLQLVFDLLQLTSPEIWFRFRALNFEPFFTLSWFLTWFTHILSDSNDIHRLYDLFMASEPSMLIYLSVSVSFLSALQGPSDLICLCIAASSCIGELLFQLNFPFAAYLAICTLYFTLMKSLQNPCFTVSLFLGDHMQYRGNKFDFR